MTGETSLRNDTARELLDRAEETIDAADRERLEGNDEQAIERAFEAFVLAASAALHRDGMELSGTAPDPAEVMRRYLERFGRGGRLYGVYLRWLLDISDCVKALSVGQSVRGDGRAAESAVDRARMFWEAVDRFLARTPQAGTETPPNE